MLAIDLTKAVHGELQVQACFELGKQDRGILFGKSGAGKSTLLRLIAGLESPDSGSIRLGDEVLFDKDRRIRKLLRHRRVGMIFQDDLLFPHLSVEENIGFGLLGQSSRTRTTRIHEVANLCGVSQALFKRRPESLSGGERQRVGLARSLAPRPGLLLCDEPVSALDLEGRFALIDRLRQVQEAENLPLLYVTHGPEEAIALGTQLFLMDQGRIVDQGPPLDVLTRQNRSLFTGARNLFTAIVQQTHSQNGETRVQVPNGPELILPYLDIAPGRSLTVSIMANEIMIAKPSPHPWPISARNQITATVEQIHKHGAEAEIVARVGQTAWIVSVVINAITALELSVGCSIVLIIKSRSIQIIAF